MENSIDTGAMSTGFEGVGLEHVLGVVDKVIERAMDVTPDTNRIIEMTPKSGYEKKIELIAEATDMSTEDKLKAIDAAENKYAQDLAFNADMCKDLMRAKGGLSLTLTACLVLLIKSPEGKKLAKSILKLVA